MKAYLTPERRRAFFARWRDVWRLRVQSGAYDPADEQGERHAFLYEVAGIPSANDLDETSYTAVMLALATELDGRGCAPVRDPWRAKRIRRIEHLAAILRPEAPQSYIAGILANSHTGLDPAKWRTALSNPDLHALMLKMISQDRANRRAGRSAASLGILLLAGVLGLAFCAEK